MQLLCREKRKKERGRDQPWQAHKDGKMASPQSATFTRLLLLWPVHLADIKGRAVMRHSWVEEIRSMADPTF